MSKREDWLKSLKVGDAVGIHFDIGLSSKAVIVGVTKSKFRINHSNNIYIFNRYDGFDQCGNRMCPWTDHDEARYELTRLAYTADRLRFHAMYHTDPILDRQSVRDLTDAIELFLEKNK